MPLLWLTASGVTTVSPEGWILSRCHWATTVAGPVVVDADAVSEALINMIVKRTAIAAAVTLVLTVLVLSSSREFSGFARSLNGFEHPQKNHCNELPHSSP